MNQQSPKWLTATWTILATVAGALVAFGQNYAGWASANPDQAGWLGWSATGIGAITGVAGIVVAIIDKMNDRAAAPEPPSADTTGKPVDQIDHLVSMAIQLAAQRKDHARAAALLNALTAATAPKVP